MDELPENVRAVVKAKFQLLKDNPIFPFHPSLRIKPMQGFQGVWEGHISESIVFTFERSNENGDEIITFRKIGKHNIYKKP